MEPQQFNNVKAILNQMLNVDLLVELVEERPAIWDKSAEGYRNKEFSIPAWEEINKIMFNTYDSLGEDMKKFIGKLIKQKWTTARDIWQRSHRKRKEAIQNGEQVNELKDNARYEKLKFLAKVYDREDYLKTDKDEMFKSNQNNFGFPPSPQEELKDDKFPKLSTDFDRDLISAVMKQGLQQQDINILSKKRRLEHSSVDVTVKTNHVADSHKPMIVNVGDGVKIGSFFKPRTSVDGKEANKSSVKAQTPKREQMYHSPRREERPSSTNLLTNNSSNQTPKKLKLEAPNQSVKPDNLTQPGVIKDGNAKHEAIEECDQKNEVIDMTSDDIKVEPTSSEMFSKEKSPNTELENFFQLIRHHITEFNKDQIMGFFFEILKKRIDKKEMMDIFFEILKPFIHENETLDFQIEALQLIKKKQNG